MPLLSSLSAWGLPLSPGDRLKIMILDGEEFSGNYEVSLNGNLKMPYLPELPVKGLELPAVEQLLTQTLVREGLFKPEFVRVNVSILEWAPVDVLVSGAVFEPGRVQINEQTPEARALNTVPGNAPSGRTLTSAIRNAGGAMPNANIQAVRLIRARQEQVVDLSGVLAGEPVDDVPLIAGDQIIVPHSDRPNNDLVRPSQITIPGVRVFLSNLTVPAAGNAQSSVSRETTSFAYGARFSHAVISANCVGGTKRVNANRRAILVRADRSTGKTLYVERSIEDLLRKSENDADNPFLMPDDGVACYDSKFVNVRDIFQTLGDVFNPFAVLINLIRRP